MFGAGLLAVSGRLSAGRARGLHGSVRHALDLGGFFVGPRARSAWQLLEVVIQSWLVLELADAEGGDPAVQAFARTLGRARPPQRFHPSGTSAPTPGGPGEHQRHHNGKYDIQAGKPHVG